MPPENVRHDNVTVPKIRRCPRHISQEQWEQYVESLFPKYSIATHKLVQITTDSAVVQFDVMPLLGGESNAMTHRVVIRGQQRGDSHCTCAAFRFGIYGTCPHIMFAISQLRQHNDAGLLSPNRPYSEIFVRHGLKSEIVFRASPDAPRAVHKVARSCFDSNGILRFDYLTNLKMLISRAADYQHELLTDNEVFERIAFLSQQKERHRQIIATFRNSVHSRAFDALLHAPLATYQREAALNAAIAGRFLLFDSPGLGRRRTAIAAAEILAQTVGIRRVLVLTNTPTLHTWQLELQQSTAQKSLVIWGNPAKRCELYDANVQYMVARYDDLQTDIDVIIGRMKPDLILLDETHTLKQRGAKTARIVRRLESEHLFILSGADPVRVPGPFVSFVDMIDRHRTGLLDDFLLHHQQFDLQKNTVNYANMSRVSKILPQHFRRFESAEYRRSLPDLIEHDRFLPLTESQAEHHADLQSRLFHLVMPWRNAIAAYKKRLHEKNAVSQEQVDNQVAEQSTGDTSKHGQNLKPVVVPINTLHETQTVIAGMLRATNDMSLVDPVQSSGCKLETMFDLLQEHLELPHVKAVVFSHESRLLRAAKNLLAKTPVKCGMIDRYTPLSEQKHAGARFFQEPNFRVLFVGDGVSERLTLRNVQLIIHLDLPWDADWMRLRHANISVHPMFRPCHAYRLISYGTIEHWLAKLALLASQHIGHELFLAGDLRDGQSITLLDEPDRTKIFEHVIALLEQVKEPPMVLLKTND